MKTTKTILIITAVMFFLGCNKSYKMTGIHSVANSKNGQITSVSGTRKISGIYPHLTTYSHGRENGSYGFGNECGIGALAVWNDKLYMLNYAAHQPKGSEHKLYIIDEDKNMHGA